MNKLIFKVNGPKDGNLPSLLKAVTKIRCRIYIDFEKGLVTVENVYDEIIDSVIDLINEHYVLLGVDIDNLMETSHEVPIEDALNDVTTNFEDGPTKAEFAPEEYTCNFEGSVTSSPIEVSPKTEDDLVIKKIKFKNPTIEAAINKLLRTAFWVTYKQCGNEREIADHIRTAAQELSLKYKEPNCTKGSAKESAGIVQSDHLSDDNVLEKTTTQTSHSNTLASKVVSSTLPKGQTAEDVLLVVVNDALKQLEPGGSILTNTKVFLEAIGMPIDNPFLNEAFIAATDIKKINYENIIASICEINKEASEDDVKSILKEAFRNWTLSKEELAPYGRLPLTSLLKLFAKAVNS